MNRKGKQNYTELQTCPVCEMDAGVRKMTVTVPEQFFVVCECCGFKTRPHKTQGAATLEWNGRSRRRWPGN